MLFPETGSHRTLGQEANALKVIPFSLKVRSPILVSPGNTLHARHGFQIFLKCISTNGAHFGRGECTPLPGLHRETVEDCLSQFHTISKTLEGAPLQLEKFQLRAPYFGLIDSSFFTPLYPALAYALEETLLTWYLTQEPGALSEVFNVQHTEFSTPINALIVPSSETLTQLPEIAHSIRSAGFQSVKIKVGRLALHYEVQLVQGLSTMLGSSFQIRLDGNQLFTQASFEEFTALLKHLPIEYFEEPLPSDLLATYERSSLPIALDESVATYLTQFKLNPISTVQALVVKPSILGGIHQTVRIIDFCNEHQLKCVLSSTYDTGWNIATYALLARLIQQRTTMGFDTYRYLEEDTLSEKLHFRDGKLWLKGRFWNSSI